MAVNETLVEIVRFTSKGVSQVVAETKAMGKESQETHQQYKTLVSLLQNPAWDKHTRSVSKLRDAHEQLALKARNTALAQRLGDGSAVKQLQTVTRLNKQYADMQRRVELTARYGERLGRFMHKYGGLVSGAGHTAGFAMAGIAGAGMGLARQGFHGTVEQARFDSEMTQLARELAGVMKPVMELMTKGAKAIRQQLQKLDQGGQDLVMGGLLLGGTAGGALALRSLARMGGFMGGAGGAAGTAASGAAGSAGGGFFGGGRGMLRVGAGVAGAGLLTHGAIEKNPFTGIAGGAMLGWAVGGPVGAVAGGAIGAVASSENRREGEKPSAYYDRMRAAGHSKVGSTLMMGGEAISALFGGDTEEEAKAKTNAARRQVQLAGGGFEATGSGYDRLSAAIEKVEGERTESERLEAATRELTDEMRRRRWEVGGPLRPGSSTIFG